MTLPEMVSVDRLQVGDVFKRGLGTPTIVIGRVDREDGSRFLHLISIWEGGVHGIDFMGFDPAFPNSIVPVEYLGRGSFEIKLPGG